MTLIKLSCSSLKVTFYYYSLYLPKVFSKQAVGFRRAKDFFVLRLYYSSPKCCSETRLLASMETCGNRTVWVRHPPYVASRSLGP